jgi:16S rRNA (guanine527-N7)-methyltransferase
MTILINQLVSQETLEKFEIYEQLLREWNNRTMLVQKNTLSDFSNRHILDSLQLIPLLTSTPSLVSLTNPNNPLPNFQPSKDCWEKLDLPSPFKSEISSIDIGTGAGFPGMVLAMCGFKKVSLCESNQKKCLFLEEVARKTNTDVTIMNDRVENVRGEFDIVLSRACTDLDRLLEMMNTLLPETPLSGFFHKGRSWKEEVSLAQKRWKFSGAFTQSVTSKDGVILYVKSLEKR